ncbi:hypothetical protein MtrunA17_Chr1g0190041 [Medicago truncatula]|uniref:Uncharacterized protein n=1 Tax=Medicago truncatula TaxID=3880 RepID=A0A396JW86_MEDTR|nr:hypothetical protein MtrunA17_Chr1g0190041 [Medicago truncatula]
MLTLVVAIQTIYQKHLRDICNSGHHKSYRKVGRWKALCVTQIISVRLTVH